MKIIDHSTLDLRLTKREKRVSGRSDVGNTGSPGVEFRVSGFGFRVSGFGFRVSDSEYGVCGAERPHATREMKVAGAGVENLCPPPTLIIIINCLFMTITRNVQPGIV